MIVISGALVLVALVLLVIGLIDPNLGFVYASIAVSLASFGFLVVGILQRRKEVVPVVEGSAATAEGLTAILSSAPAAPMAVSVVNVDAEPAAAPAAAGRDAVSGQVLVVQGRPRYHVEGCRYLTGKSPESVDVGDAREEGFTACGVCKPDLALEAAAAEAPEAAEPAAAEPVVDEMPALAVRDLGATTTRAVARVAAPAKKAPAKAAPAKASSVQAAPLKTAAKKAAAAPVKRGGVIVIPDRGKYHTPDCRYVRGAEGTLELTKAAATKQGYQPCGVCNP